MHGKYNIEWRYVQECLRMWKWEHLPPFEEGDNFTPSLKRNVEVCQVDGRGVGLGGVVTLDRENPIRYAACFSGYTSNIDWE